MMLKLPENTAKIFFVAICVALLFTGGYLVGVSTRGNALGVLSGQNSRQQGVGTTATGDLQTSDLQILSELYSKLAEDYINPQLPAKQDFVAQAAKGMLTALNDKYTAYYTAAEWAEIQKNNAGEFEGIGVKLKNAGEVIQVETPLTGSPAALAGVMPLDQLKKVNDQATSGMSLVEVAKLIRGPVGSEVKIEIFRPSNAKTYTFNIIRQKQDSKSVTYQLKDGGIVINVARFIEASPQDLQIQWDDAVNFALDHQAKFVVLDLRNNTGGWVSSAKYVLEDFLPNQTEFLKEVDRNGNSASLTTQRTPRLEKLPLTVLVNEGSASASEIVSGALQDYGRAQLIGKPTTGKGVEQTMVNTSDGGVFFIIFKRWYTPKGRNLSADQALTPDQKVELTTEDIKAGIDPQLEAAVKTAELSL